MRYNGYTIVPGSLVGPPSRPRAWTIDGEGRRLLVRRTCRPGTLALYEYGPATGCPRYIGPIYDFDVPVPGSNPDTSD